VIFRSKLRKLGRWEYYASGFAIALTIALAVIVVLKWELIQSLEHYGYLGAFLVSLFGGATVIAPVPMIPVVFALGAVVKPSFAPYLGPVFIGLAAGLGDTLGSLTIYLTGVGGRAALANSNHRKIQTIYPKIVRWVEKRGTLTLFILSAVVNPFFYPAGLAAGALRFGLRRYFFICWTGKTIKHIAVAYAGYWGLRGRLRMLGMPV